MTQQRISNGVKHYWYCSALLLLLLLFAYINGVVTEQTEKPKSSSTSDEPHEKFIASKVNLVAPSKRSYGVGSVKNPGNPDGDGDREILVLSKSENSVSKATNGGGEGGPPPPSADPDDEDKKTLSQQVADGKYGLIQKEIFPADRRRPGILSYDINPEVPKDNINNLGGLEPDDIWLAENHLLVLAGGGYGEGSANPWRPIDNYIAPSRQVKIPEHPKIPPPFPVQLSKNGPIEYIKGENGSIAPPPIIPFFLMFPPNKFPPFGGQFPPGVRNNSDAYQPYPIRPLYPNVNSGAQLPPPAPPSFYKPQPGSEFIPPSFGNLSDSFDEDDPSLYYPPPYDFYYPKDNVSKVPAGPLVPGIVLPPPPDFFSLSSDKTASKQSEHQRKTSKVLLHPDKPRSPVLHGTMKTPSEYTSPITYEDIVNEITYPDVGRNKITYDDVIDDKNGQGWVPIPAPKPYYITGPRKPIINDAVLIMSTATDPVSKDDSSAVVNGYEYNAPKDRFTPDEIKEYDNAGEKFREFYTTPENLIDSNKLKQWDAPTTTVTSANMYHSPVKSPAQSVQTTYYFYEEPKYPTTDYPNRMIGKSSKGSLSVSDGRGQFKQTIANPNRNNYLQSSTTPSFLSEEIVPTISSVTTPPTIDTKNQITDYINGIVSSKHKANAGYNQRRPKAPIIPIYYLAELDNLPEQPLYPYKPSSSSVDNRRPVYNPTYAVTTSKPTYTINEPNFVRPTAKPVFEYSYTATGYGENENYKHPSYHNFHQPDTYLLQQNIPPVRAQSYHHNHQVKYDTPQSYQIKTHPYQNNQPDQLPYHQIKNDPYHRDHYQQQQQLYPASYYYNQPYTEPKFVYSIQLPSAQNSLYDTNSFLDTNRQKYPAIPKLNKPAVEYNSIDRPWDKDPYEKNVYQTENPFYAFFTREDEDLIDENTKKYFTIFGQKIRKPATEDIAQTSAATVTYPSTSKWNQYGTSSKQRNNPYSKNNPPQKENIIYRSGYSAGQNNLDNANPNPTTVPTYSRYQTNQQKTTPFTQAEQEYGNTDESSTISLEGDTLVNYINPPVTNDPDAELVDVGHQTEIKPVPKYSNQDNRLVKYVASEPSNEASSEENDRYSSYTDNSNESFEEESTTANSMEKTSKPASLKEDTAVNYKKKRPLNPNAEYVNLNNKQHHRLTHQAESSRKAPIHSRPYRQKLISLAGDTAVNYKNPRPPVNPEAEYIYPPLRYKQQSDSSQRIVSYNIPNTNGGHYFFITPKQVYKLDELRQPEDKNYVRKYEQLEAENYDFQADAEKPSGYFKRMSSSGANSEDKTNNSTAGQR